MCECSAAPTALITLPQSQGSLSFIHVPGSTMEPRRKLWSQRCDSAHTVTARREVTARERTCTHTHLVAVGAGGRPRYRGGR